MVDTEGYEKIQKSALETKAAVDTEQWEKATTLWGKTEVIIDQVSSSVDFYNILTKISQRNGIKKLSFFNNSKLNHKGNFYYLN